jgi:RNA polymerase sigma-70 factor (ECF subfamily)
MVFTVARRMLVSTALAEDVLQDTFVEVIRKAGSFRGDAEIGFWIKRIAINKCLSHLRSAWVVQRAALEDPERMLEAPREERPDRSRDLARALDALPAVSRAVVLLHDVEGYTHKEIGKLMGRSTSFSKSQLARAHERLRGLLSESRRADGHDDDKDTGEELCVTALKTC